MAITYKWSTSKLKKNAFEYSVKTNKIVRIKKIIDTSSGNCEFAAFVLSNSAKAERIMKKTSIVQPKTAEVNINNIMRKFEGN